jgi:hypothetical protein
MTTNDSNTPDPEFSAALRALAADDAKLTASPNVEKRLLAAVRNISRMRRRRAWFGVGSAAAVLLLGIALHSWRIGNPPSSAMVGTPSAPDPGISEVATDFLPPAVFPCADEYGIDGTGRSTRDGARVVWTRATGFSET